MNYNAVKVTLDDGRSFIVETLSVLHAVGKLERLGKLSRGEVAHANKVWCDFDSEVVK